ncbi:MAG: excinuclease ABC subunit UvrA [Bdellovibrionales bacterium]
MSKGKKIVENFDGVTVKGAREHNLKNIDVQIPRNKITVVTGLSGSGKSSLAFDTIYAEGQRRYVESLSAYARNFLEQLKKPEVDYVKGLSPAIAIEQKTSSVNPRSTVGTVTEIYDYLRLLFARVGVPHCPNCHIAVTKQSVENICKLVFENKNETKFIVLAPVARGKKGEFHQEFARWIKMGYTKARVDGQVIELAAARKLKKTIPHDIDLIIDRLVVRDEFSKRTNDAVSAAVKLASGLVSIEILGKEIKTYSLKSACQKCGFNFPEIEPRFFSFNNPRGACPECNGIGFFYPEDEEIDPDDEAGDGYEAVATVCSSCLGRRLKKESLSVLIDNKNIMDMSELQISHLEDGLKNTKWPERETVVSEKILSQIFSRLSYLNEVGVGYLSLNRSIHTLSGGEAQRVRLATQIGTSLVGVLYVLDEPSIGLHPRDHHRLLDTLRTLRDRGNTVLLVEHDEDTIRAADYLLDIGPRAGILGGSIMAEGMVEEVLKNKDSLTARYLSGLETVIQKKGRSMGKDRSRLRLLGASGNNLKNLDVDIPLNALIAVTGVSGSGKSTLIIDTLYKAVAKHFNNPKIQPATYKSIEGLPYLERVIEINQRPIGRTPRSNPATYVGLFSLIRLLYAEHPDSKIRGYKPGRFSFNVKGGRCEKCMGAGQIKIEMHFLPDVFVLCEVCQGQRYNRETLNIKYKGKSIADVLNMSVKEALPFFENHKFIHRKLATLNKVGLEYITLGQSSTSLSGGEAQRVKLSRELSRVSSSNSLYILDEPTTGLHFDDVRKLIELLHGLVDQGNTVVVIEHHLDVIASSDHVIDLGPEGGSAGGSIVAIGTPEQVAKVKASHTGRFLAKMQ